MLNNKELQKIFIKVTLASFALTLVIAAPYITKRLSRGDNKNAAPRAVSRSVDNQKPMIAADENDTFALLNVGKASEKQVKPGFGNLPSELFPGNRAFALDFHKLPLDYMVPQQPEITRTAILRIRELQIADLAAVEAQRAMAKNYEKTPKEEGSLR